MKKREFHAGNFILFILSVLLVAVLVTLFLLARGNGDGKEEGRGNSTDYFNGEIVKITSDGMIERTTFVVNEFYFTQRTWGFDSICREHTGKPTADNELEDLLDICGYFGMTEDEVMYLLEMGYSYDEIEEFLWNPRLYEREVLCQEL